MESAGKLGLARYRPKLVFRGMCIDIKFEPSAHSERERVMTDIRRIKVKSLAETKLRGKKRNRKTYE